MLPSRWNTVLTVVLLVTEQFCHWFEEAVPNHSLLLCRGSESNRSNTTYSAKRGASHLSSGSYKALSYRPREAMCHACPAHFTFPKLLFSSHQDAPWDHVQGAAPVFILFPHPLGNWIQHPKARGSLFHQSSPQGSPSFTWLDQCGLLATFCSGTLRENPGYIYFISVQNSWVSGVFHVPFSQADPS